MILSQGNVSNPLKKPEQTKDNLPTIIDRTVFPGVQGGPHMHAIAGKAVAFYEAQQKEFQDYAKQVVLNAKRLADELDKRGFRMVTGGTDNHLILIDVKSSFDIDGNEAETALEKIGLIMNKNAIPDDPLPPFRPSGLRIGTPAVTSRGMKETDMTQLADLMQSAVEHKDDDKKLALLKEHVKDLTEQFPLPSSVDA